MDPAAQGNRKGEEPTFLIPVEKDQKPFKCGLCSFAFDIILQLDAHVSEHTLTKPFQCGFCLASYDSSSELTQHVNTHQLFMCVAKGMSDENPTLTQTSAGDLGVKECVRSIRAPATSSSSERARLLNMNTQYDIPKQPVVHTVDAGHFACTVCGLSFNHESDWKEHALLIHGNEKPFQCDQCPSRFQQNVHLTDHVYSMHKPHKQLNCPFCAEKCESRNYLKNHIAKKHPGMTSENLYTKTHSARDGTDNTVPQSQLPFRFIETDPATGQETEEYDNDQATADYGGYSGSIRDDNNVGNAEDDEALPHVFLTTSLSTTNSAAPVFSNPQTAALWNILQQQPGMKTEAVDFKVGTADQHAGMFIPSRESMNDFT